MGLKSPSESELAPDLPLGYDARLASLHARVAAAAAASGLLLALAVGAILVTLPAAWPAWLVAEAVFLAVWVARKRALDRTPVPFVPPAGHDALETFKRFSRSLPVVSRDSGSYDLVGRWFDNAPQASIRRQNVRDLLAWGFGYRSACEFDEAGEGHVPDAMLRDVEAEWGNPYESGTNDSLRYMAHLREPLRAVPKPLAWYLLAEGLAGIKHAVMLAAGFTCSAHAGFLCYTQGLPPPAAAESADAGRSEGKSAGVGEGAAPAPAPAPLVFSHGVGLGLLPYLPFVMRLAALGRPMVAIEYPHLAMRWTRFIPTVDEGTSALLGIMDAHGIQRAAFVGHSFGTFFLSRLQRLAPERVECMALLDPVCMCMWSGHLIRSFVYHPYATKSGTVTWSIARDIHTAAAVARDFFWSEYNLWPDDFPEHTLVVLSGNDDLVPVQHAASMARFETNARVMLSPEAKHADFLIDLPFQREILAGVWGLIDSAEPRAGLAERGALARRASEPAALGGQRMHSKGDGGFLPAACGRTGVGAAGAPSSRISAGVGCGAGAGCGKRVRPSEDGALPGLEDCGSARVAADGSLVIVIGSSYATVAISSDDGCKGAHSSARSSSVSSDGGGSRSSSSSTAATTISGAGSGIGSGRNDDCSVKAGSGGWCGCGAVGKAGKGGPGTPGDAGLQFRVDAQRWLHAGRQRLTWGGAARAALHGDAALSP